jgi:hypothetical protein
MVANAQTAQKVTVNKYSINDEPVYDFNGSQLNGKTIDRYRIDTMPPLDENKVIVIHQILTTDFKRPDGPSLKVRVEPGGSMPLTIVDGVVSAVMPTPEEINSVEVLKPNSPEAARYGEKGKNGIVVITTKSRKPTSTTIYIIDGQKSTEADMKALNQNKIKSVDVVKGKAAKKYTDDPNVGVVIVNT